MGNVIILVYEDQLYVLNLADGISFITDRKGSYLHEEGLNLDPRIVIQTLGNIAGEILTQNHTLDTLPKPIYRMMAKASAAKLAASLN